MSLDRARTVADAVLYEGYLLYPYRATSRKNQARWQFGVLGPPGAVERGVGEEPGMSVQCLLDLERGTQNARAAPTVTVYLRFLQLQRRIVEALDTHEPSGFFPVDQLVVEDDLVFSWDEAVEQEQSWPALSLAELAEGVVRRVEVAGGDEIEPLAAADGSVPGRIVRRRWPLSAELRATTTEVDGYLRLTISVENTAAPRPANPDDAVRTSLIGAHLLIESSNAQFVSLLEPPAGAADAAAGCRQHRCWPVLAGPPGSSDIVLGSPIILYDYPEVAPESAGALFDSTEIDEILTLRVMTMTDEEKAEARATDPRAREIVDRSDQMTPEALQQLHGILRQPRREAVEPTPWWDPASDASVRPELDSVLIEGVPVSKGSRVRIHPSRRADAQDLFFADQDARVTAVVSDVDGQVHVAVVLVDDPAADLHDWYGRYLYFAPEELRPLADHVLPDHRKEGKS
ncbi:MAG TPA: hypothetical protein VJ820_04190 [Propionibacteriaceae bacterium]|nr:hypothetical protein [Propionibacteriaceae bacterium]